MSNNAAFENLQAETTHKDTQSTEQDSAKKPKDKSRSGREFAEVCKLINRGLSKEEIFSEMMIFSKWADANQKYREYTFKKAQTQSAKEKINDLTEEDIPSDILELLKKPNFFDLITEEEFDKKIVGEIETRKVIFLCGAGGRLVRNAQISSYNLLVNDESGAGKDYITGAVLEILPKDIYIKKTRISPTVFTYWHTPQYEPNWTWDGRVFYNEDISEAVLNSDVFKVMCSSGSSATIVIKQRAYEIDIKGKPVMITTTATAIPNPELTRRFVFLNLDSSEDQTKAIMKRHSDYKQKGIVPEYNPKYQEALSCLKRVKVRIPFAGLIDPHFPSKNIIMRTQYPRFLDYIAASTGLYQYQRETDSEGYTLAAQQDYEIARACFLKLCSNKYMIPLTINQKNILAGFENDPHLSGSASELHNGKMSFLSLKALITNLRILVKYGILEITIQKDTWNRDIECFSLSKGYKPNERLEIPSFKNLCKNATIPSERKEGITGSIPSIPRGAEGVEGIIPEISLRENVKRCLSPEEYVKALNPKDDYPGFEIEGVIGSEGLAYCKKAGLLIEVKPDMYRVLC